MKKVMTLFVLLSLLGTVQAQTLQIKIEDISPMQNIVYCASDYDSVIVKQDTCCPYMSNWRVFQNGQTTTYEANQIELTPGEYDKSYYIEYQDSCTVETKPFWLGFATFHQEDPIVQDKIWKRPEDTVHLTVATCYNIEWSNGSTSTSIDVTKDTTYWVRIFSPYGCGELSDTVRVCNGATITSVTGDYRDLRDRIISWEVKPSQTRYVDSVHIYAINADEDCSMIGTAPYECGEFHVQNEATPCNYYVVAVGNDGQECPNPSSWISPIIAQLDLQNHLSWSTYETEDGSTEIARYYIFGVVDNQAIEYKCRVDSTTTSWEPEPGDTISKLVVVAETRNQDEYYFSNIVESMSNVSETSDTFKVYPNPANVTFTVEGTKTVKVVNTKGQVIAESENNHEKHTFSLPPGLYFIKPAKGDAKKVTVY